MPAKRVLFPVTSFLGYGLFCKMVRTTWLILTKSLSSELEKVLLNKVLYVPVPSISVFLGRPSQPPKLQFVFSMQNWGWRMEGEGGMLTDWSGGR